jgi:hypothetical protein
VARAYPSSGVPNTTNFFVPGDQHVAQRNLVVVPTSGHPLTFKANSFGSGPLSLINPPPNAKLRAVLDLHPNNFVRNTVTSRLASFPSFQHIRTTSLSSVFRFDLTNLHPSGVVDHSHPPLWPPVLPPLPPLTNPSYEVKVFLDPLHLTSLTFLADVRALSRGEACIFHLLQTSVTNTAQGGLTLVVLRV